LNQHASIRGPRRWRVLCRVALFLIGCAVILAVASPLTQKLPGRWPLVFLGTLTSLGTFALTVFFVRWEGISLKDVGAALGRRSLPLFAFGLLIGLFLVALSVSIQTVAGHLHWVRTPGLGFSSVTLTLAGFIALACREELGFRGYPLRRLECSFGLWGAQIFVALAFSLEHWLGGWPLSRAVLGAGVGSIVFGMAAIATRGLALPIGMHAAFNLANSMIGQGYPTGLWKVAVGQGQEGRMQNLINFSYLVSMGLALLAFWLWHRGTSCIKFESSTE
jgi:membrane protease YdiL (CAAX protease family)